MGSEKAEAEIAAALPSLSLDPPRGHWCLHILELKLGLHWIPSPRWGGTIVSGPIIAGRIHEYKFGRPALVILAVREGG